MSRVSNAVKAHYTVWDSEVEGQCYFCPNTASMDDLTPSPKAPQHVLGSWDGDKILIRVCSACWHKIYAANIAKPGTRFLGAMTFQMKRDLMSGGSARLTKSLVVMSSADEWLIPPDAMKDSGDNYYVNGVKYSYSEIEALQWPFSIVLLKMRKGLAESALDTLIAMGLLQAEREEDYRGLIGL